MQKCHAGHEVRQAYWGFPTRFFCDCGAGELGTLVECCCLPSEEEKKNLKKIEEKPKEVQVGAAVCLVSRCQIPDPDIHDDGLSFVNN